MKCQLARVLCRLDLFAWLVAVFAFASCDVSRIKPRDVLAGHVQDAAGNPIKGVKVEAIESVRERDGEFISMWGNNGESQFTDVHGNFTISAHARLGPGESVGTECKLLMFTHSDYADVRVFRTTPGLDEMNLAVTLEPASTIEVLVKGWIDTRSLTVKASVQPIPFVGKPGWSAGTGLTNGSDTCLFENVPAGVIYVQVSQNVSDSSPFGNTATLSEQQAVTIQPGDSKTVEFRLGEVGELFGTFESANLDSNSLLRVALHQGVPGGERSPPVLTQWSGCNGQSFTLPNLTRHGGDFFLRVHAQPPLYFDHPLPESAERDRDIGLIEIR